MTISSKTRKNINRLLFVTSLLVVVSAVWATLIIVRQISGDEHHKVKMWASSIQRKADLIEYSKHFFEQIELAERNKLQLWANALSSFHFARTPGELDLYSQIVEENTTIPVIVTDQHFKVLHCANVDVDCSKITYLRDTLLAEFTQHPPLRVPYMDDTWYFFYKHPKAFIELQQILDDIIHSFIGEIVINSIFAPILVVSKDEQTVIQAGNISSELYVDSTALRNTLNRMRAQNTPIEISIDADEAYLIFYESSIVVKRLAYLPIIAFIIFGIFIFSIIWGMRLTKQSENDKLWVGMSRETAHQLGTPLSSLIGWLELLKNQNVDENYLVEIEKDINRLVVVSERFSKIGSQPKMVTENIVQIVNRSFAYLQPRISQKIKLRMNVVPNAVMLTDVNVQLFEWVLENLTTNAVDAIGTKDGLIEIDITEQHKTMTIDVVDNGKGIPKNQWRMIFEAGFTTKSRGWGLGLPLCYRIIRYYHKGDIFVKQSVVGEGTTIRIVLNK